MCTVVKQQTEDVWPLSMHVLCDPRFYFLLKDLMLVQDMSPRDVSLVDMV